MQARRATSGFWESVSWTSFARAREAWFRLAVWRWNVVSCFFSLRESHAKSLVLSPKSLVEGWGEGLEG